MSKVQVGQTVGRGYRFLLHRFFAIVGLSWLPALALGVGLDLWFVHFASDLAMTAKGGTAGFWLAVDGLSLVVALAFFVATIAVPLAREALGLHDETVFAHFVVGRRELRLFFALLRFGFLMLTAAVLLTLALGFAARAGMPFLLAKLGAASEATASWRGVPLRALVMSGSGLVLVSVLAFLALRLGFFLTPIAAIEERARVTRAWMLSAKNFWRLAVITFALALPIDFLARGVEYALFGRELTALLPRALAAHDPALLFGFIAAHAPAFAAIGATVLTLLIALFAGASALAYRTLMPAGDMQTVWRPSAHETVEESHGLPAIPAMAAPPLDLSLGEHQVHVAEPAASEASAPAVPEASAAVVPEVLPEAGAPEAAMADHAAASEAAASTQAVIADPDALPAHGETQHTVLELADEEPATTETVQAAPAEQTAPDAPAAETKAHETQSEPAVHAASPGPVTDVAETVLPTGDPAVEMKARELETV